MTRELVLIHGRSQQDKDPAALKTEWLEALNRGLPNGRELPTSPESVRFPYYGDTLDQMSRGVTDGTAAAVVIKGTEDDTDEQNFLADVLDEARQAVGITDQQIQEAAAGVPRRDGADSLRATGPVTVEKGVRPTAWMHAVLQVLDEHVPGAGAATLALVTRDVYQYLRNPGIRDVIDSGVRQALTPGVETIVVGHSLGSVVAYNILRKEAATQGWQVPLLVTVGCPLGVKAIRTALAPVSRPPVADWFNAADPRDVVALWPLSPPRVNVTPAVRNKIDVDNHTDNRHGISGYLDDPDVAKTIYDALTASD
ncbi:hypothetical protein [Terrabacter sp. RAF57]|uniref:hypothetical protein n=1 Tax=Terrabacter sp. RAF57 TaxID=3233063 RepID=UPI003F9647E8